jgi:iron complex transport system ATP-binding protein
MSGGEKQRVFLARALAQEPELLLLDEPTTHLDINHQIEIMDLIRTLHKEQNLTVLSVTHDLNLAAEYCDTVLLMSEGKVVTEGNPSQVITGEIIKTVYGADTVVSKNPKTGAPHLALVPRVTPATAQRKGIRVHVICGGGTASDLIRRLVIEGYSVSVGVLNEGDSDHRVATSLANEVVTAAPFSPVSDSAHARNLQLARTANVVVISAVPIGQGNIRNLDAAIGAASSGVQTVIFNSFETQDFCSGKATDRFRELIRNGAAIVEDISGIFEALQRAQDNRIGPGAV